MMQNAYDTEQIVKENMPLVKMIAARLFSRLPSYIDFDDLMGNGLLGLMEAYRDYRPDRNVKFSTFAFYRIRGAMLDGLRALDWLPRTLRGKINCVDTACEALEKKLCREPSEEEIAEQLNMNVNEVRSLMFEAHQAKILSLEEELHEVSHEDAYAEPGSAVSVQEDELLALLSEEIKGLKDNERLAFTLYYYEGLNLKEIGEVMGLGESRISQILAKGISTLRKRMKHLKNEI